MARVKVPVEIWTGFGPHPKLDVVNPYNKALFKLHDHVTKLIRKACVGDTWLDKPGSLEQQGYVWTEEGWRRERY